MYDVYEGQQIWVKSIVRRGTSFLGTPLFYSPDPVPDKVLEGGVPVYFGNPNTDSEMPLDSVLQVDWDGNGQWETLVCKNCCFCGNLYWRDLLVSFPDRCSNCEEEEVRMRGSAEKQTGTQEARTINPFEA